MRHQLPPIPLAEITEITPYLVQLRLLAEDMDRLRSTAMLTEVPEATAARAAVARSELVLMLQVALGRRGRATMVAPRKSTLARILAAAAVALVPLVLLFKLLKLAALAVTGLLHLMVKRTRVAEVAVASPHLLWLVDQAAVELVVQAP